MRTPACPPGSGGGRPMGGFRDDPDYVTVLALEVYDDDTGTATKAPIFHQRVNRRAQRPQRARDAADAVALCLDELGHLDLATIARLLAIDEHRGARRPRRPRLPRPRRPGLGHRRRLPVRRRAATSWTPPWPRPTADPAATRATSPPWRRSSRPDLGPGEIKGQAGRPLGGGRRHPGVPGRDCSAAR